MSSSHPYDLSQDPPAPILPLRLGGPTGEASVAVLGLVDSGADMTVIPEYLAGALSLPVVGTVPVAGAGWRGRSRIFAARLEVAGDSRVVEVLALGGETLLGRDLLNRWRILLDGPAQVLELDSH